MKGHWPVRPPFPYLQSGHSDCTQLRGLIILKVFWTVVGIPKCCLSLLLFFVFDTINSVMTTLKMTGKPFVPLRVSSVWSVKERDDLFHPSSGWGSGKGGTLTWGHGSKNQWNLFARLCCNIIYNLLCVCF